MNGKRRHIFLDDITNSYGRSLFCYLAGYSSVLLGKLLPLRRWFLNSERSAGNLY